MKTLIRNIQLAVSALEAECNGTPIAEHRLTEIAEAQQGLAMTRGMDVVAALHGMIRSGRPLQIELHDLTFIDKALPDNNNARRFALRG